MYVSLNLLVYFYIVSKLYINGDFILCFNWYVLFLIIDSR